MNRLNRIEIIAKAMIQKINKTPHINKLPKKLDELLFQHHSPYELQIIAPQTYKTIIKQRSDELSKDDAEEYANDRALGEDKYRSELNIKNNKKSFTYASIVGFNLMEDALDYPGFTYFFHLTIDQINKTLFGIVDKKINIEPALGLRALKKCLATWIEHKDKFVSYEDKIIGLIDPRIEVIIPYIIIPELVVVEIEQR